MPCELTSTVDDVEKGILTRHNLLQLIYPYSLTLRDLMKAGDFTYEEDPLSKRQELYWTDRRPLALRRI